MSDDISYAARCPYRVEFIDWLEAHGITVIWRNKQ
jgi:hypothetical protein